MKKIKNYKTTEEKPSIVSDREMTYTTSNTLKAMNFTYHSVDDRDIISLIGTVKHGINYKQFDDIATRSPFSMNEWSGILHLSERTMLRYKKEQKTFEPLQSEKILEIILLNKYGIEVFGDEANYNQWLEVNSIALGGKKPKDLLDSSFGISLVKDELGRIEHGVLA